MAARPLAARGSKLFFWSPNADRWFSSFPSTTPDSSLIPCRICNNDPVYRRPKIQRLLLLDLSAAKGQMRPACSVLQLHQGRQAMHLRSPARGKRKRTKPPREGLHAKLERYEKLLSLHGIKTEPSDDLDDSGSESDACMDEDVNTVDTPRSTLEETKPKLIIREGVSRYFDR